MTSRSSAFGAARTSLRRIVRGLRLEGLYDRSLVGARRIKAIPRERAWQRVIGGLLTEGIRVVGTASWARPGDDAIPVVVCLWNRPDRAAEVTRMLRAQVTNRPIRLLLWNNNPADAETYRAVARDGAGDSLASIDLYDSPVNIGGLARFVAARLAVNGGYQGPIVMLDDDQDVSVDFIEELLADYEPRSVVAWWAFSQHGSYWRRAEIDPGTAADHAGTGGTVYDSELVTDDRFFARLPRRFAFLEDQWMSFAAHQKSWRVVKASTHIELVSEELNQYHGLKPLKDEFFHEQRQQRRGSLWGPPRVRPSWRRGRIRGA